MRKTLKPLLTQLATQGKPLVEIHFKARSVHDKEFLIRNINYCADDIECSSGPYTNENLYIQGTKESLGWFFHCTFLRKLIRPEINQVTYYWVIDGELHIPEALKAKIEVVQGLSQPGYDDDGQDDVVSYLEPQRLRI